MAEVITEYRNENTKDIDFIITIDMVRKMNEEDLGCCKVVGDEAANRSLSHLMVIAKAFAKGGKIVLLWCRYFQAESRNFWTLQNVPPHYLVCLDREMVKA